MVKKYYLDTSIWVDLVEERRGFMGESLSAPAFKLLINIKIKKQNIILSNQVLKELKGKYSDDQIKSIFLPFSGIIQKIKTSKSQESEARSISSVRNVPFGDVLHAIIARDNDLVLITRDKHFKLLLDIVDFYKPEEANQVFF